MDHKHIDGTGETQRDLPGQDITDGATSMVDRRISRRSFGMLGAGAIALGASLSGAAPAVAATSTFRVGTLNIKNDLSAANVRHDLNLIASNADLIGLQECQGSDRTAILRDWADRQGWTLFKPSGWAGECPILARRSHFTPTSQKGAVYVCDTGGDGTPPPPRWITRARFKHRASGRYVTMINTHLNAGIHDDGRPRDLRRTRDAEKHIRMVRDMAQAWQSEGQVVVVGDFNVDYPADRRVQYRNFPYTVLEEREAGGALPGLRSSYSQLDGTAKTTHNAGRIDYVYEWVRIPSARKMRMNNHFVVTGTKSDHRGLVARFAVTS